MKKKFKTAFVFILVFSFGCRMYKRLEKFDSQRIVISSHSEEILFKVFKYGIENQIRLISLDTCRITKYEIKSIKGPFFSDHRILIDKKWYSLNLSKAWPIVLYRGNIYYLEEHHVIAQNIDSLAVKKVIVGLSPCSPFTID